MDALNIVHTGWAKVRAWSRSIFEFQYILLTLHINNKFTLTNLKLRNSDSAHSIQIHEQRQMKWLTFKVSSKAGHQ